MNRKEAAKELLRIYAARKGLIDFTRYTFPKYRPADHHYQIAEKLEAVERGDIKRLMIMMPPRHGKSELASRRFGPWCLGRNPERELITGSYNLDLAMDFGRDSRNIIKDPFYGSVFPETSIASDSGAANRWHTNQGGGYVAAGVGTAVTGRGAHIFTIDDPFKDREDADSERRRNTVYNWYTSTAYTRLESELGVNVPLPDDWLWNIHDAIEEGLVSPFEGAIVLIQTRWHDDDLAGRLLEDMANGADHWEILELPAINEKTGTALWSQKYPIKRLKQIEKAIGPRDWSALYQQKPQPDQGTFFHRDWFKRYDQLPKHLNLWMTSDYAVSEGKGDFTEHSVWGICPENNIYLVDNWHGKTTAAVWIDEGLRLVRKYKPYVWFGEGGVIRRAIEPFLRKAMQEQKTFIRLEWLTPIGDKPARARAFQARAENGKVYLPNNEVGNRALDQLIRFPTGKNDDFVDTASEIGQVIDTAHEAFVPTKEPQIDYLRKLKFKDIVKATGDKRKAREKNW